jgi:hypothetical protein
VEGPGLHFMKKAPQPRRDEGCGARIIQVTNISFVEPMPILPFWLDMCQHGATSQDSGKLEFT